MGYAKFNKKDNSSMITYVGSMVTPVSAVTEFNRDLFKLDELMRLQNGATRTSYNDITKRNFSREESTSVTKERYMKNLRYVRDAFSLAEQLITAQKALIPEYLRYCLQRKSKVLSKQDKLINSKRGRNKIERLKYIKTKLNKLDRKIICYERHIENDTVIPAVFGGKSNIKLLSTNKITKEEWVNSRRNSLYSIGEKSKGGNENIKLSYLGDTMFTISALDCTAQKNGTRLNFIVKFPTKMVSDIVNHLATGEAYTIRICKEDIGYSVHITMSSLVQLQEEHLNIGVAGIDINPDNISISIVDAKGNFKRSKIFKFPELNYVSSKERDCIVGKNVRAAINYIKSMGIKVVVVEDLKFLNSYQDNSNTNRLFSNFAHAKIVNTIISRCYKEELILKKINPAYTSIIGRVKYQKRFGLSVHEAAAICIARKGLGLKEKFPKKLLTDFFAMEVKDKIKISKVKYNEYWRSIHYLFSNSKFNRSIYKLDKFKLEMLGIERYPKDWLFEDYLVYAEVYILELCKSIFIMQYS